MLCACDFGALDRVRRGNRPDGAIALAEHAARIEHPIAAIAVWRNDDGDAAPAPSG